MIEHDWGQTFRGNPDLLATIRMQQSRERYTSKWGGKDVKEMYEQMVRKQPNTELAWMTGSDSVGRGEAVEVVR